MIDVLDLYLTFGAIPNTRRSMGRDCPECIFSLHFSECDSASEIHPGFDMRSSCLCTQMLMRIAERERERERERTKKKSGANMRRR